MIIDFSVTLYRFLLFNCTISPKPNFIEINFPHAFPNSRAVVLSKFSMSSTIEFFTSDSFSVGVQ